MKRLLLAVVVFIVVMSSAAQDAATESVIALVNSARTRAGLPVLVQSVELNIAAQLHSDDMAQAGRLDHVGSNGSQFWERMTNAGYILITGAENILLRGDTNAQAVFNQWWNSPPHQTNMMNRDYVEVGLAYATAADGGVYFTMVLGAREGVIAPLVVTATPLPPTSTPLPPTFTPIPPTATVTPLPTNTPTITPLVPPTRTLSPLITPAILTPLPTLTANSTSTPIITPTALPPDIRLIYDADSLTLLNISDVALDLSGLRFQSDDARMGVDVWDTEFLTERLDNFSAGDCLQVWGTEFNQLNDVIDDCETRHGWVAVNSSQLFWQGTTQFFVVNGGTVIGVCQVFDGVCDLSLDGVYTVEDNSSPLPVPVGRDIRLIFNLDSLTILNIADVSLDLRGVFFQSNEGQLAIEKWNTEFLTASLSGFPVEDCLMVWTTQTDNQPAPLECETRHGWIVATDAEDFWRNVSRFEVVRDNRILAGCLVANGFCDVSLEGNLGANSPTLIPANPNSPTGTPVVSGGVVTSSVTDLTMVYSLDSFGIINTSGRSLDVTGLVFESDNGVLGATRWQTDFLTSSLSQLPSGDCLQVWGVNEQLQSKPATCNTRHGWIAVASEAQFWRNVSQFRVRYGADFLGTCDARAGRCQLNFP